MKKKMMLLAASACCVHSASAQTCPQPFRETFDSLLAYSRNWREESHKMPGEGNLGYFDPNYVSISSKNGYARFMHKGYGTYSVGGQITTKRTDFHFGEYTFVAQLPNDYSGLQADEGFVFGMFTYGPPWSKNEIDYEYVYRLHSYYPEPADSIYAVAHTEFGSTVPVMLYTPSSCIGRPCQYSFKWHPDRIEYYVNGQYLHSFTGEDVPQYPAPIMINFWSGIPGWGGSHPSDGTRRYAYLHEVSYAPFCP